MAVMLAFPKFFYIVVLTFNAPFGIQKAFGIWIPVDNIQILVFGLAMALVHSPWLLILIELLSDPLVAVLQQIVNWWLHLSLLQLLS
jgi:hypothetical protein